MNIYTGSAINTKLQPLTEVLYAIDGMDTLRVFSGANWSMFFVNGLRMDFIKDNPELAQQTLTMWLEQLGYIS